MQPSEGVIAQAMAQPEQALHWMRPWVTADGWIALATVPGGADQLRHPDLTQGRALRYAAPRGPERVGLDRAAAPLGSGPVTIVEKLRKVRGRRSRRETRCLESRIHLCYQGKAGEIPQGESRAQAGLGGEG